MNIPSTKNLLLFAVFLFILGQFLIAPNATRKPMTTSDGAIVYRSDGSPKTEMDVTRYMKSNWEGFTLVYLSFAILVIAVGRFIWSWMRRAPRSGSGH